MGPTAPTAQKNENDIRVPIVMSGITLDLSWVY